MSTAVAQERNRPALSLRSILVKGDAFGGKVFADLAKRNMEMFEGASRAFSGAQNKPKPTAEPKPAAEKQPSDAEIELLREELAALRDKVDRLTK